MTHVSGAWLDRPGTQRLFDAYEQAGFRLLAVGGCVRNALLGRAVSDTDMASDARPDTAMEFLTDAGFKVIPTGIDHGTLTVLSDDVPYEITTFRSDVESDGRHAVVRFSTDVTEDAQRRDFTINALYADRTGRVLDPVGGLADIDAPSIRFVGDARARIEEDYLRTLRFFRFHAWYAAPDAGFDPDVLAAIAETLEGLQQLSRERIGAELIKLLSAPDPAREVATMAQCGVLSVLLPGADITALGPVIMFEAELGLPVDPILRLSSLIGPEGAENLRLSKQHMRKLMTLREAAGGIDPIPVLAYRHGYETGAQAVALRHASLTQPVPNTAKDDLTRGAEAKFPVTAADLQPAFSGPALGQRLRALEEEWIASDFGLSKSRLLS